METTNALLNFKSLQVLVSRWAYCILFKITRLTGHNHEIQQVVRHFYQLHTGEGEGLFYFITIRGTSHDETWSAALREEHSARKQIAENIFTFFR
jgi:hypothetical protein